MSLQYDLDPLAALELFYNGEHHGIYKNAFIRNEKKKGLVLPDSLREFLEKFGFNSVNAGGRNSYRIFHPDNMTQFSLPDGNGGEVSIIVIGALRLDKRDAIDGSEDNYFVGIRPDTPELQVAMGQESESGTNWWGIESNLTNLLTNMFLSVIGKSRDSFIFTESAEIRAVLRHHGFEMSRTRSDTRAAAVHFNDKSGEFLVTLFDDKENGSIKELRVIAKKELSKLK